MPHAAAIYCRISHDPTGAGLGVTRQREDCEALARDRGWPIAGVYIDNDVSAYSGRPRPEYQRMLNDIANHAIDAVIIWHPDRLHRSPKELEAFIDLVEATGAQVATCTAGDIDLASSDGRFLARIVGSVARKESEDKSRRTIRKHLELAHAGKVSGGGRRPFGYETDRVTIREEEANEIRDAARRILAGESLRGVTLDWQARGVATVAGGPWSPTTVKRLLCSGRISGQREHRGPGRPGQPARMQIMGRAVWPGIITPEETARLRVALSARSSGSGGSARSYLLTGFVRCGTCGTALSARAAVRKGNRYRRYHCAKDRGGCDRVGISAARLEEYVTEMLLARLDTGALARLRSECDDSAQAEALIEVQELEASLEQLARDFYADRVIARGPFLAAKERIEPRLAAAREQAMPRRPVDVLADVGGDLRAAWETPEFTLARKRAVLAMALDSIVVAPTTRANNRFDPRRVQRPAGDVVWRL